MKNHLTLLHFDSAQDLLDGVDMLQQHRIVIREIYSAEPIPGIELKLGIKRVQMGGAIFKFGCLGGMALTSLGCYFLQHQANWKTVILNLLVLLVTLIIADRLFAIGAPKVFTLNPGDKRCLVVVDTQRISVHEAIAHLFQYTSAVEISVAIKNIVIS
jgi:hypothetical protein